MLGEGGADTLRGAAGADSLVGGDGDDNIAGEAGADTLFGGEGNDLLLGGAEAEVLFGEGGDDSLIGGAGSETLDGGVGNDYIAAGGGADSLLGGDGSDTLAGGLGLDTLNGGAGADTFLFNTAVSPANIDTIIGYAAVDDSIHLENAAFTGMVAGGLAANAFLVTSGSSLATATTHRIIYDQSNGNLYFDLDGLGGVQSQHFATLSGAPALTFSEFTIV